MSSTDTEILRRYAPPPGIKYLQYSLALEKRYLPQMRKMISEDLSEPYSIYVYRYFLYQWGELCYLAVREQDQDESQADHPTDDDPEALSELGASPAPPNDLISVIICKLEPHRGGPLRGYIAMLATKASHRGQGIARALVRMALDAMIARDADEIALETEESNAAAMALYESLGFLRSKKLHRYYLNGNSAYRLLLYCKEGVALIPTERYGPAEPWDQGLRPPSAGEDYEEELPGTENGEPILGTHVV